MADDLHERQEHQHENADNDYAFLQETIKGDQMNGRRFFHKVLRAVCYGFFFGAAAIIAASLFHPLASNINHSSSGQLSLSKEESVEEQSVVKEEIKETKEEKIILNADSYAQIYGRLKDLRKTIEPSLADVCGYAEKDSAEMIFRSYGCILAEDRGAILLLTCSDKINKSERLDVTFYGGQVCVATVRATYDLLNLAIIAVDNDKISKTTQNIINPAKLGTSAGMESGAPVLALGNIFGFTDSVGYGIIQDMSGLISVDDGEYYRLLTDIQGEETGSGVLINLQGDIIGVVSSISSVPEKKGIVTGVGITELKPILEYLLNGKNVPYIGISGIDITEEASIEKELPVGIYVEKVSADSPAMNAGIKNGDIFVGLNGEDVSTIQAFHRTLMKCKEKSEIKANVMRLSKDGYVDMEFDITLD